MIVGLLLLKSRLQPNMKQGETSWKTQKIIIFLIKSKLNRSYIFPTTNPPQSKACASPDCKMTRSRYLVSIISQLWPFHDIRVEYKDCQSFRSCPSAPNCLIFQWMATKSVVEKVLRLKIFIWARTCEFWEDPSTPTSPTPRRSPIKSLIINHLI